MIGKLIPIYPMKKTLLVSFALLLLVLLLTACSLSKTPTQPAASNTQDVSTPQTSSINGKKLLDTRCTVCHSTVRITQKKGTYDEWEQIVSNMISRGAVLSEEEKTILVQYLADNYSN